MFAETNLLPSVAPMVTVPLALGGSVTIRESPERLHCPDCNCRPATLTLVTCTPEPPPTILSVTLSPGETSETPTTSKPAVTVKEIEVPLVRPAPSRAQIWYFWAERNRLDVISTSAWKR